MFTLGAIDDRVDSWIKAGKEDQNQKKLSESLLPQ